MASAVVFKTAFEPIVRSIVRTLTDLKQFEFSTGEDGTQAQATRGMVVLYFVLLFALAFPALKIQAGIEVRIGQFVLLGAFAAVFFLDLRYRTVEWSLLLSMTWIGLVFWNISSLSEYPKIKEHVFVVKHVVLYPASVYLGLRMVYLTQVKSRIAIVEQVLGATCLVAIALHLYPVPALIHERPSHLSVYLKGSFWEQWELAFFLGLFFVMSLSMRFENALWPRRLSQAFLYVLVLACMLWSMNKTVWVALAAVLLSLAMHGRTIGYLKSRLETRQLFRKAIGRKVVRYSMTAAGLMIGFLVVLNSYLPQGQRLVSEDMLLHKWESERGAALMASMETIRQNPWLGTGLGSVAGYVAITNADIVGMSQDTGQLFNSFLDLWVSVGFVGPVFLIVLLWACFSRHSFPSVVIAPYLLAWMMFNPSAQLEYFYLFLGMSLGYARIGRSQRKENLANDNSGDRPRMAWWPQLNPGTCKKLF